jgi:hypothetical protein
MTLIHSRPKSVGVDDPELLFKEARRRRQRRWLISGTVLTVVAVVIALVSALGSSTGTRAIRIRPPRSVPPQAVGLPTGGVQSLVSAGPLAVNATGSLFVVDEGRHEVLVRLTNGRFRVVAGNGTSGFAGDGGPATNAELSDVTDVTFGPNGDLYLADNGRVRVIDPQGVIETIAGAGNGGGPVTTGAPAGSPSSVSQIASVAVSPSGVIYAATPNRIYRVATAHQLQPITAIGNTVGTTGIGYASAPINSFGQIAVDSQGNIYASSDDIGWSIYKITPDGTATHIGAARGTGGTLADVQLGPGDAAYAGDGSDVVRAEGDQLVPFHIFDLRGPRQFFYMQYFSFSPNGVLYADNIGESAFSKYQKIVSFDHGKTTELWRRRVRGQR